MCNLMKKDLSLHSVKMNYILIFVCMFDIFLSRNYNFILLILVKFSLLDFV